MNEPVTAEAVKVIARSDILRSEATMALPALRHEALRPAGLEGVKAVVGSRFATFTPPDLSEGEWVAWWTDMNNACGEIPLDRLEAGMQAHINTGAQFLPKAGELRQHALAAAPSKSEQAYTRAATAVRQRNETPRIAAPRPSREEVSAMMAAFHAQMAEKAPKQAAKPQRPTPSAQVDERGISDDARRLLRRQGYAHVAPPVSDPLAPMEPAA